LSGKFRAEAIAKNRFGVTHELGLNCFDVTGREDGEELFGKAFALSGI